MFRRLLMIPALVVGALFGGCAPRETAPPLKAGASAHIVIGPYVQPGRDPGLANILRVVWWTDVPGPSTLEVRDDQGRGGSLKAETVPMEGLYRHSTDLISVDANLFFTAMATITVNGKRYTSSPARIPFPGGDIQRRPFRFAALGDTGAGTEAERKTVEQVIRQHPELLVITGDVVYDSGEFSEYRKRFFPYYADLMKTVPILPTLGNHDTGNPETMGRPYCEVWMPPGIAMVVANAKPTYTVLRRRANRGEGPVPDEQQKARNYSVDAGGCHFVSIDSTADHDTIRDFIVPWLKEDLKQAKRNGAKWLIAFWHHPPYTRGAYRDNRGQWGDIRELIVPVLRQAGVQLVLNGHDHNYQHMRKDGIDYIITGAGGARLYPIVKDYTGNDQPPLLGSNDRVHSFTLFEESSYGGSMSVRQIDENGHQLDAFTLPAPAKVSEG